MISFTLATKSQSIGSSIYCIFLSTLSGLAELKRVVQLENLKWVIDHVPEGTVESVLNFCHYTLNDDKLVDFLDYFEEKGVGVIPSAP